MGKFVAGAYIDEIVAKAAGAANPSRAGSAQKDKDDRDFKKSLNDARKESNRRNSLDRQRNKEEAKLNKSIGGLDATMIIGYGWLKKALSQSKIFTTTIETLVKLLGFLVDVVLMPFLPYIVYGLVKVAEGIMAFKKFWDDFTADFSKRGVVGLLFDVLTLKPAYDWLIEFLRVMFFGNDEERRKNAYITTSIEARLIGGLGEVGWALFTFLFGSDIATPIKEAITQFGFRLAAGYEWWTKILTAFVTGRSDIVVGMMFDWAVGVTEFWKKFVNYLIAGKINLAVNLLIGGDKSNDLNLFPSSPLQNAEFDPAKWGTTQNKASTTTYNSNTVVNNIPGGSLINGMRYIGEGSLVWQ
jgi:hypothetical protein